MAAAIHYLLLFAKYPYHGKVKTRLEPALGIDGAHQFAMLALKEVLQYYGQLNGEIIGEGATCKCVWCYAPSHAVDDVESLLGGSNLLHQWSIWPQNDAASSLGDRLSAAIGKAITDNEHSTTSNFYNSTTSTCTLVGSDCFQLTRLHISGAMQRADNGTAMILPAEDGGYVLLSIPILVVEPIFDDISWSSAETAIDQITQLKKAGYDVEIGDVLSDVYEREDLVHLLALLEGTSANHLQEAYPNTIDFVKEHMLNTGK